MANDVIKIVAEGKSVELKVAVHKLIFNSLLSGIAWGFGSVIGATIVVGLLLLFLGFFDTAPIVGEYISKILNYIQEATPNK